MNKIKTEKTDPPIFIRTGTNEEAFQRKLASLIPEQLTYKYYTEHYHDIWKQNIELLFYSPTHSHIIVKGTVLCALSFEQALITDAVQLQPDVQTLSRTYIFITTPKASVRRYFYSRDLENPHFCLSIDCPKMGLKELFQSSVEVPSPLRHYSEVCSAQTHYAMK